MSDSLYFHIFIISVIDGGYSEWCPFTPCSVTCGGGVKHRSRTCTNPPPENGGKHCDQLGPEKESQVCNTEACRKCHFREYHFTRSYLYFFKHSKTH